MNQVKKDGVAAGGVKAEAEDEQRQAEATLRTMAQRYQEELPDSDPVGIEVILAMLRTVRMHRTAVARQIESLGLDVGMTGARYTLLLTLYFSRENLLAQNEISKELNVSRTNITNLIDGLERDGLVQRVPNPADRRVSYAQLTRRGATLCTRLMPELTHLVEDATHGFSQEEKTLLSQLLYRVQRNIVVAHPGQYARGVGVDPA